MSALEKENSEIMSEITTKEKLRRRAIAEDTTASDALEGIPALTKESTGHSKYAYELQERWIEGELTSSERCILLKARLGL